MGLLAGFLLWSPNLVALECSVSPTRSRPLSNKACSRVRFAVRAHNPGTINFNFPGVIRHAFPALV
jgi:hypothetical protein